MIGTAQFMRMLFLSPDEQRQERSVRDDQPRVLSSECWLKPQTLDS
jgi:hypothetical protein